MQHRYSPTSCHKYKKQTDARYTTEYEMARKPQGVTLIEMMLSVTISGILVCIAIPSFLATTYSVKSSETRAILLTDLMRVANKAGIYGVRTTLCPSANGVACSTGFDWSIGWIGFMDQNGNREREPNEALITHQPALRGTHLISSNGRPRIVFQSNGGNAGRNATFTLCDKRGAEKAQTLVISNAGNLRDGLPNTTQIALACKF
jgi:type IV fimbrial biogenesis protein FimT